MSYDKVLPNPTEVVNLTDNIKCYVQKLTIGDVRIICSGINWYKGKKGYNLNPYSVLITYCSLQGLDLIKEGYLEV